MELSIETKENCLGKTYFAKSVKISNSRPIIQLYPTHLSKPKNRSNTRCGLGRDRTGDLTIFSRSLVPTELPSQQRSC